MSEHRRDKRGSWAYWISVCPDCRWGPLVFDPDGLDKDEGMYPRAKCRGCERYVIDRDALSIPVEAA